MNQVTVPYSTVFEQQPGEAVPVVAGVERVLAANPNPFTFKGTGTYIVDDGAGTCAVIDPGPDLDSHVDALSRALGQRKLGAILVTHTHSDHSPATSRLRERHGGTVYAGGPHPLTRDDINAWGVRNQVAMAELIDLALGSLDASARAELSRLGELDESGDLTFAPDVTVGSRSTIEVGRARFEVVATPGHISNHACFVLAGAQRITFTGDHVMGWSTTVITPPDGDMAAYMASLDTLATAMPGVLVPTHGAPVWEPEPYLQALAEHRRARERQIVATLTDGPRRPIDIVRTVYQAVSPLLYPAAAQSVLAHLIDLWRRERVAIDTEDPLLGTAFELR